MVSQMIMFLMGITVGIFFSRILTGFAIKKSNREEREKLDSVFNLVLDNLRTNKTTFINRVNDVVSISTNIKEHGDINLVYILNKKSNSISIFKDGVCLYTTNLCSESLVRDISTSIDLRYKDEIDDYVEILGMKMSRSDLSRMFGMELPKTIDKKIEIKFFDNSKEEEESDVLGDILSENESSFDIDEVLEKISSTGMNSLSQDELDFLKEYSDSKNG